MTVTSEERRERCLIAATLTRKIWERRRSAMVRYLTEDYRGRTGGRFNPKAAAKAVDSFIETMVFVAEETGEPMIGGSL